MKIKLSFICLIVSIIMVHAQSDLVDDCFESLSPLRQLKCGLWMNTKGDIAYKEESVVDSFSPPIIENDTIVGSRHEDSLQMLRSFDHYITNIFNLQDSPNNEINNYQSELKNIVDTTSFQILSRSYCKDKNNIYK